MEEVEGGPNSQQLTLYLIVELILKQQKIKKKDRFSNPRKKMHRLPKKMNLQKEYSYTRRTNSRTDKKAI